MHTSNKIIRTNKTMIQDIHLKRVENEPWGFRLFGGADSEQPVTIIKVKYQIFEFWRKYNRIRTSSVEL